MPSELKPIVILSMLFFVIVANVYVTSMSKSEYDEYVPASGRNVAKYEKEVPLDFDAGYYYF